MAKRVNGQMKVFKNGVKILGEYNYGIGYWIRHELHDMKEYGGPKAKPMEMWSAYNDKGSYIGNPRDAQHLCAERGIRPILIDKNHRVCSIGKSVKDGKWYGWSHRAIYGFKIGDKVKKGDCHAGTLLIGFKAKTEADCKKMAIAFAKSVS